MSTTTPTLPGIAAIQSLAAADMAQVNTLIRDRLDSDVLIGDTLVRFQDGGPEGRPELVAEVLL